MKKLVSFPGLLALLIVQFLFLNANAQAPKTGFNPAGGKGWLEMIQDPDVNFYEVQADFYKYWENRTDYKGNGWKVFKRWEYINQSRVLPDGKLQAPGYVANIYGKYMKDADKSPSGAWTLQGPSTYVGNNTGQPTGMGRINAIAFHPGDANTIFIGSPSGGFWKTTDGGASWTNLSNNLPTLGVSSILVHPLNPNIIYIGSGDRDANDAIPMGVFRTTDGGATWTQINTAMGNVTVGAMVMHPSDPNAIIAATSGGIFKTTNGGNTWSQKASGNFKDLQFKPGDPATVYAVRITTPSQFYRSSDTGDSWTQVTSGIPTAGIGSRMVMGVSPANPAYVYLLQIKSSDGTLANILRSTDSGQSFESVATGPNLLGYACDGDDNSSQANYDLCMTVDPLNVNNVFVGGINNWKSNDAGVTWTISSHWIGSSFGNPCASSVHADQHCYAWSPLNGRLYAGHDGGIHYTADGGAIWTEITNNLAITQVYRIGQGAGNVNYSVFGCQDNGCAATTNGTSYFTTAGGDGMECVIDYDNSNYCFNTYYGGITRRSTTGPLGSYSTIAGNGINGIDESGAWVSPYFLHKSDPNTMFLGLKNVWRYDNIRAASANAIIWEKISTGETENCIAIEQSPADLDVMYALRANSLTRTDNANASAGSVTWTSCALPGDYDPTDIKAHPANANIVYLTTGYSVFKSSDKGLTWTDISANLPPLFINCLVLDKNANEGIYIGNQTGVWYKDASLTDWVLFSTGLPPVDIRELEIYYDDITPSNNRIKCGTYGRGMWQSDMIQVNVVNPANFSAFVAGSSQIDLSWTKNPSDNDVVVAWSPIAGSFGQPADGTSYSVGDPIPGGGTVLYVGPATGISHSALTPSTTYYYKAWSVNGSSQYSGGVLPISATTDCTAISAFPYAASFDNIDCWKPVANAGDKSWQFGSTINPSNPPTILTSPYAFFKSNPGSQVYFDSDLISPPFDLSALGSVVLKFNHHYDGDNVWSSIASVYYTTDNGLSWNLLSTYTTDQNNTAATFVVPGAAGQSNVKFVWNYFDDAVGSYMWGIDDVQVMECSGIWTGNVSADWHTPGNWCDNTVPTATTDVLIPAGAANMPDISTATVAYCRDITIQTGASLKMSAANSTLEVKGNWNMLGSFNYGSSSGSAMVLFNGTTAQTASGTSSSNLKRVTFDNAAGITLTSEIRSDNVWLTNGIVTTTGSGKVNVFGGSVTRANGWVNGILQKYTFTNPSSVFNVTYETGDATHYTPVDLSFPAGSITSGGGFSMKTTPGDHAAITSSTLNASKSVNRTWSVPLMGITFSSCNATFNFVNDDLDAGTNTNNLVAGQFKSSAWSYPSVGAKTVTSTQVTGLTSATLGDIQLAEACTSPDIPTLSSSSEPICAGGSTTLSITSGNLNSATSWQWYTGSCGGSPAGSGASINVSPASTTTYYVRGEGGCAEGACASITVNVNSLPLVSCPGNMSVCVDAAAFTLTGGSPAGGTYSGPGVSGGMFNPAVAGTGVHTITYSYTDGNNCTGSCTFTITVNALPLVSCPGNMSACVDAAAFTLTGGSPAGGTYSGPGVSGGMFNPAVAGTGVHTITYSYTDGNNCTGSCTFTVTVNALPLVSCPGNMSACVDAAAFTLTGGSPAGGTYSGPSVSGGMFNPAVGGTGVHTITYSYTDGNNCTGSCTFTITVNALPLVSCPGNMSKLLADPPFALSGGSPGGGTYSGTGVSGGNFNPALAGTGTHTITYSYTNGNNCTNTCAFTITVSEGGNTISGNIMWEQDMNLGVNQTTVALSGDQTGTTTTNTGGVYSFTYTSGTNFNVTPTKNINKLNGVTVADVTAIQQHVANIAPLPAPFKRIAADVNKSNSITTLDATVINQALLGNPSALAQIKTSWRFVPSAYTFPNPNVPWGFPEKIVLTGVSGDVPGQDFKGIKTADVVTTYANPANFGAGEPLVLRAPDVELKAGDQLSVEFRADQMPDLASFQLALAFDPAQLGFESIQPLEGLSLTADNFGLLNLSQGEIRVAWSQLEGAGVEEAAPVFQLTFSALQSGSRLSDALQVMADVLSPVSYNSAFEESPVKVVFEPAITTGDHGVGRPEFPSLASVPNPFSGSATILFVLPESCEAELRVYSAEGRILKRISGVYPAGKNAELLELGADTPGGLLYCELVTPFGIRMHRMVLIRNR